MKYTLRDGKEINLNLTYRNLFKFQREYEYVKDLVSVITRKGTVDHESMLQTIYAAYMGGENEKPLMDYETFLDNLSFNFNRDMITFSELVSNKSNEKN